EEGAPALLDPAVRLLIGNGANAVGRDIVRQTYAASVLECSSGVKSVGRRGQGVDRWIAGIPIERPVVEAVRTQWSPDTAIPACHSVGGLETTGIQEMAAHINVAAGKRDRTHVCGDGAGP